MSGATDDARFMFLAAHDLGVAVPCAHVRRLMPLGALRKPPRLHRFVRGWVDVDGATLPAVDLRRAFDRRGRDEELRDLVTTLEARREDHVRWLRELEASVRERRPFTLQTDPTKCAFGKWYAAFQANDPLLRVKLLAFDRPHRRIHALAHEAFGLVENGQGDRALALIDAARERDLAELLRLFGTTIELIAGSVREIFAVCHRGHRRFALIADDALGVGELRGHALESDAFADTRSSLASSVLRREGLATLVLDLDRLDAALASG
jgi:purine-binding chemotaxis protein CheW